MQTIAGKTEELALSVQTSDVYHGRRRRDGEETGALGSNIAGDSVMKAHCNCIECAPMGHTVAV